MRLWTGIASPRLSSPLLSAPPLIFTLPTHSYRRPGGPRWVGVETGVTEALFLCLYGKRLANEIPFRGYRQVSSPIRHFSKNTHSRTYTHIFSVSSHLPPLAILITWSALALQKALDSAALLLLFIQHDSHSGLSWPKVGGCNRKERMIIVVMNTGDNNEKGNWEMVYGRPPDFPFPAPS